MPLTRFYYILTTVFFLDILLDLSFGVSLRGYWPDRVLFWTWLILTVYTLVKYRKQLFFRIWKWVLLALVVLSFFPMGLPAMVIVMYGSGSDLYYQKRLSNGYELRIAGGSPFMGHDLQLLKPYGPVEVLRYYQFAYRDEERPSAKELVTFRVIEDNYVDSAHLYLQFADTAFTATFRHK